MTRIPLTTSEIAAFIQSHLKTLPLSIIEQNEEYQRQKKDKRQGPEPDLRGPTAEYLVDCMMKEGWVFTRRPSKPPKSPPAWSGGAKG